MASISKRGDKYRAQVFAEGIRESKSFRTLREAKVWSEQRTTELRSLAKKPSKERHTFADAMKRYEEDVSPSKKGHKWEKIRLEAFRKDPNIPSRELMGNLTTEMFVEWRDARLREVSAGSVLRDISLLSDLLETAKIEWKWIDFNPLKEIRKPKKPPHRDTVIQPHEARKMLQAMGYSPRKQVRSIAQCIAVCFLTAMRTGCRASELTTLNWENVHADYCLVDGKTGKRNVPLTRKAIRLMEKMRGFDPQLVFGIKSQSLDANFRKYKERAGLSGFTFHDTRHTAATMMARKLNVLDLCRMFGWSSAKQALVYYNPSASSIADILNGDKT
jgi:integrase